MADTERPERGRGLRSRASKFGKSTAGDKNRTEREMPRRVRRLGLLNWNTKTEIRNEISQTGIPERRNSNG